MGKTKKAGKMAKRLTALLLAAAVGMGSADTTAYARTAMEETEASMAAETTGKDEKTGQDGWDGVTTEDVYEGGKFQRGVYPCRILGGRIQCRYQNYKHGGCRH